MNYEIYWLAPFSRLPMDSMIAFWVNYWNNNIEERLYATLNPKKHGEFGIVIKDGDSCNVGEVYVVDEYRGKGVAQ